MDRARLYVSISPDLGAEREVIGRAVAGLPVDVGWEVAYTPGPLDFGSPDPLTAAQADVYIIALGTDIRAPMGVEWGAVRRARRPVLAWLKDVAHTPAAQDFAKAADLEWTPYAASGELAKPVQLALAQALIKRAGEFRLSTPEWDTLQEFVKTLGDKTDSADDDSRSGAGQGGVIFAPSREAGKGGVIVGR